MCVPIAKMIANTFTNNIFIIFFSMACETININLKSFLSAHDIKPHFSGITF